MVELDADISPVGTVDLVLPSNTDDDGRRLRALLLQFSLPALLIADSAGFTDRVSARLICDEMQRPLRVATVDGELRWAQVDSDQLNEALFVAFGRSVTFDGEWLDGVEPRTEDMSDRDPTFSRFVWATRTQSDLIPMAARLAGEPLGVVDNGDHRLVSLLPVHGNTHASPAFLLDTHLMMWRYGHRRGIASLRKKDLLLHVWDGEPEVVDPTSGWEQDSAGMTVHDYLADIVPSYAEPAEWAAKFKLDSAQSERLRIVFRRPETTPGTFAEVADILDVSPRLAEVAEGIVDLSSLPGYSVIHPGSLSQTVRAGVMDDLAAGKGSPFSAWYRFSARHPRWRIVITAIGIALSVTVLVGKIVREDFGTIWIPILALVLWGIDVVLPRSRNSRGDEPD